MAWPAVSARSKNWGTEILTDADLENEFDIIHTWLNAVMNSSSGHKHDGTTSEGPKILTANIDDSAGSQGDVFFSSGSAISRLAAGTSGQVLTTAGAGADPTWENGVTYASAAEVLTGTESAKAIAPDTLYNHEGIIKGWISFNGTTNAINDSYNIDTVAGITDNGTGDYTVPFDTDFGGTTYAPIACANRGANPIMTSINSVAAGTVQVLCFDASGSATDATQVYLIAIGDR